jgi:hypothetical protein
VSVASRRGPLVLGVLCGTLLLLFVLLFLGIEHSRQKVRTYRAELESRGESLQTADLAKSTPVASNEAGRELLAAAGELAAERKARPFKPFHTGMRTTEPGLADVMHLRSTTLQNSQEIAWARQEQILQPSQHALNRLALAALSNPEIVRDYHQGYSLDTPYAGSLLQAGQILSAECVRLLHEGKIPEAVDRITISLALARFASEQPTVIDQLIAASIVNLACSATWEILQSAAGPENLSRLQSAWAQFSLTNGLTSSLRMERSWVTAIFTHPNPYASAKIPSSPVAWAKKGKTAIRNIVSRSSDELHLLQSFQSLIEITETSNWGRLLAESLRISRASENLFLSNLILPPLVDASERIALTDTAQKIAVTALAIRRYQIDENGRIPHNLESLVPRYLAEIPRDLMDGAPLRYRLLKNGYLLYGVGANGFDDGGNPSPLPSKKFRSILDGMDIVWPRAISHQPDSLAPPTAPSP